jgi:hypothetical protein
MAKTWRRAIQKYGPLGAISFEKAFNTYSNSNNYNHMLTPQDPSRSYSGSVGPNRIQLGPNGFKNPGLNNLGQLLPSTLIIVHFFAFLSNRTLKYSKSLFYRLS